MSKKMHRKTFGKKSRLHVLKKRKILILGKKKRTIKQEIKVSFVERM